MQNSNEPLSVVIVGIGNADFTAMKFLDDIGENDPRPDIAQFVEFNRHKHDASSLTAATLEEIPDQLVGYFTRHGIMPLPPVKVAEEEIVVEAEEEEEIDLTLDFGSGGKDEDIVVTGVGGYVPMKAY